MDRKDGKRVKNISGLQQILFDLKPNRCNSYAYINKVIDVTELVAYMEKKKKINKNITYFHVFLTALGKTIYNNHKLNYFICNRHLYEHNDIKISFVAKTSFEDDSEEVMIVIPIDKNDNIDTISLRAKEKIDLFRNNKGVKEGANNIINILGKLPNILRVPIVGLFKIFDTLGILPNSFIKDNIYYSSLMVSNLGTFHTDAVDHNITNFGTCSTMVTIGQIKDREMLIDGELKIRKACEFGIAIDERISDGYYITKAFKMFEHILLNPKELDKKIKEK